MRAKMITNNQKILNKILSGQQNTIQMRIDCQNARLIRTKQIDHIRLTTFKVIEIAEVNCSDKVLTVELGCIKEYFNLRRGRPREELNFPKAYARNNFCYDGDPICAFNKGDEIKYKYSEMRLGRIYIYRNENFVAGMDVEEFEKYFRREIE